MKDTNMNEHNTENNMNEHLDAEMHEKQSENMAENIKETEYLTAHNESETLIAELNDWKDKYTRLFAEFDNYKKRTFKEKMELIQTAGKDIIVSMLDVIDDSERAEKQLEAATDIKAVKEGMQLIYTKLKNTLIQKGLKPFNSHGELFDVEKHEAITEVPTTDKKMHGKVVDEIQKGYTLNDKIIRHAKVVVGKQN